VSDNQIVVGRLLSIEKLHPKNTQSYVQNTSQYNQSGFPWTMHFPVNYGK